MAACFRADATAASAPPPPALPWPVPDLPAEVPLASVIVMAPAANTMAASTSTRNIRHHGFSTRRCAHSRTVVASTVPQEGSLPGRRAGAPAAGPGGRAAPPRRAGAPPGPAGGAPVG